MFFKRFGGNPPASLPGFGGPKKGLRACSRTSLCPYFCIFVLFFCADGRARARLPRQRANRVPARQQREQQKVGPDSALSVRNQAVSKCEARACVLRPLKCRAENAGLGAQTEKKEEKEFFILHRYQLPPENRENARPGLPLVTRADSDTTTNSSSAMRKFKRKKTMLPSRPSV